MSDDGVAIAGEGLSAGISPLGAELQYLRDRDGRDLLWDGDPAWWNGRAPLLFPMIGVVAGDAIRVDGRSYPMAKHGFARRRQWTVLARQADSATLRLEDDAETRASYPFAFRLDVHYAIAGATLTIAVDLHNPGETALPASFGFHPALRWPLPYGRPRAEHAVRFAEPEPAPIRRIDAAGLLRPDPEPTPVAGRDLALRDALFTDDALIFDQLRSRGLRFGAAGAPGVAVDFREMPQLGIWTKPGAPYLCIEPWAGIADPQGFAGEFRDKPGVIEVAPGGRHRFAMRIALEADAFP